MDGSNIVIEAPDSNRDVLAAYILEQQTLDPSADRNWSFAAIPGEVNVTFTSSPKAAKTLTAESPIAMIEVEENGLARYRIRFDRVEGATQHR